MENPRFDNADSVAYDLEIIKSRKRIFIFLAVLGLPLCVIEWCDWRNDAVFALSTLNVNSKSGYLNVSQLDQHAFRKMS